MKASLNGSKNIVIAVLKPFIILPIVDSSPKENIDFSFSRAPPIRLSNPSLRILNPFLNIVFNDCPISEKKLTTLEIPLANFSYKLGVKVFIKN